MGPAFAGATGWQRHGMSRIAKPMSVAVQIATKRAGVPHAASLMRWARLALESAQRQPRVGRELTIRIVGAAESRRLNRTWRGKDKPTNVLSFPSDPLPRVRGRAGEGAREADPLGDLAICAPVVAREAREQGKSAQAHWAHMVIHGVLHLLGYDHENDRDAAKMESTEIRILEQFGYPNPYA